MRSQHTYLEIWIVCKYPHLQKGVVIEWMGWKIFADFSQILFFLLLFSVNFLPLQFNSIQGMCIFFSNLSVIFTHLVCINSFQNIFLWLLGQIFWIRILFIKLKYLFKKIYICEVKKYIGIGINSRPLYWKDIYCWVWKVWVSQVPWHTPFFESCLQNNFVFC